jgi:glycosyltransferase involved in cell wall biosynthesis
VHTTGISTIRGGGIACKIKNVVKETKNEIDYSILTFTEKWEDKDIRLLTDMGVEVIGIPLSKNSLLDCWRYVRCAPAGEFDVFHFHELPFAYADIRGGLAPGLTLLKTKSRGRPLVYEHQVAPENTEFLRKLVFRGLFPLWKKVLVPSNYMRIEASKLGKNGNDKIELVKNGVNLEEINSVTPMGLDGISIVFFGHLMHLKGVDELVKAFYHVSLKNRQVHLHLVGDGELMGYCRNFVQEKNLKQRVHFWGAQPQNVLFSIIKGADICVLPSRNDAANLGVLEAMAAGKPIVTTPVGGIPEYVKDGRNGIVVQHEKLASAIEFLVENEEVRNKIGQNNLQDVLAYSWKKQSREYVRIYRTLIKQED